MPRLILWLIILVISVPAPARAAQGPDSYHVQIRYRIDAGPSRRLILYDQFLKQLQSFGFQKAPGLEDEELYGTHMNGTIPGGTSKRILQNKHIETVLYIPDSIDVAGIADQPVLVEVRLHTPFGPHRQKEVSEKTEQFLSRLGFQSSIGHERMRFIRLLGTLPGSALPRLLQDEAQIELQTTQIEGLRGRLVETMSKAVSIHSVEVLSDQVEADRAPPPDAQIEVSTEKKISPDLRAALAGNDRPSGPILAEVVLRFEPRPTDDSWREQLSAYMRISGRFGPLVFGQVSPTQVSTIASLPIVSTIRLPRAAETALPPRYELATLVQPWQANRRGPRIRRPRPLTVAVIADEFPGHESLIGSALPAETTYIDFTIENNAAMTAATQTKPENGELRAGTRLAVELTSRLQPTRLKLLRIDPTAAYHVEDIARAVRTGLWKSENMIRRQEELHREKERLAEQRVELRIERRLALGSFRDDAPTRKARADYRKRQEQFDIEETEFNKKTARLADFLERASDLKKCTHIIIAPRWLDGHPVISDDGTAIRHLRRDLLTSATWQQVSPAGRQTTWTGLFRDIDNDGAMDFPGQSPGSPQFQNITFLKRQGAGDDSELLLPDTEIKLTLQWKEVHAPRWKPTDGPDSYRAPLIPLQLQILRRSDPTGRALPSDAYDLIASTSGLPDRIENHPRYAIYQTSVTFKTSGEPTQYGIRLEGHEPTTTLPPGSPQLSGQERWELRPVIRMEVLNREGTEPGISLVKH